MILKNICSITKLEKRISNELNKTNIAKRKEQKRTATTTTAKRRKIHQETKNDG